MLNTLAKADVIANFSRSDNDTGSPEVQIALLTARIESLSSHLNTHKKDKHSRTGLMKLVNRRRKLLDYLSRKDQDSYKQILEKLSLRK
jgi:small subunit ribosomal protein S15